VKDDAEFIATQIADKAQTDSSGGGPMEDEVNRATLAAGAAQEV
jgi:hypothetical protein